MDKYINIEDIKKNKYITDKDGNIYGERDYISFAELDDMPAADVSLVTHAYWRNNGEQDFFCSNCNEYGYESDKFCSNCGAKMDMNKEE